MVNFEWDERKNQSNQKKHGVSFEEAVTVFFDPNQLSIPDIVHSEDEERWVTIGMSKKLKTLVVIHLSLTDRSAQTIRVISARKADKEERTQYATSAET